MNPKQSDNNWYHIRIKLKQKFPQLTHSDLHNRGGEEEDLIHMVAHKLNKTASEMREIISQL